MYELTESEKLQRQENIKKWTRYWIDKLGIDLFKQINDYRIAEMTPWGYDPNNQSACSLTQFSCIPRSPQISKAKLICCDEAIAKIKHSIGYIKQDTLQLADIHKIIDNSSKMIKQNLDKSIYDSLVKSIKLPYKTEELHFQANYIEPIRINEKSLLARQFRMKELEDSLYSSCSIPSEILYHKHYIKNNNKTEV